jgi:hypothetical protein
VPPAKQVLAAPADAGFLAVGLLSEPARAAIARSVPGGPLVPYAPNCGCRTGPGRS